MLELSHLDNILFSTVLGVLYLLPRQGRVVYTYIYPRSQHDYRLFYTTEMIS